MLPQEQHRLKLTAVDSIRRALSNEAKKRNGRSFAEWRQAETDAVWRAACDFSQASGLRSPLREEVVKVEMFAMGHCDYGAKWALYVAEKMFLPDEQASTC